MANKLKPIDKELIMNKLLFDNPWWNTGKIDDENDGFKRRLYFELFFKLIEEVDVKRAVVLMGPRRVGKTVMMHHAIDELLKVKKIRGNAICFINVENPLYLNFGLEELFMLSMKAIANEEPKGWYVFFDEIQYLPQWEVHLKVLVDSYPNTKFIVSGSAAAALKIKSNESGAGRFTEFMLPPLTFHEYIHLKNFSNLIVESHIYWKKIKKPYFSTNNIELLNKHFIDYINFGGYPEVIFSSKIQNNLNRYIKSDIIDKVLLRDLPSLYGIQNVQELNNFFTNLVYYTGEELSLDNLATTSRVNKHTLKKYLEYLEAAFLIKQINRIDECGKKFKRQVNYKIYLTNPSLRSALFSPLEATSDAMGHMVETAIFSQRFLRDTRLPCYARWDGGEVDMVGLAAKDLKPAWAVEIKWSNRAFNKIDELKALLSFCKKNNISDTVVTTIDKYEQKIIGDISINFTPAAVYAFNLGYNTILQQYQKLV